MLQVVARAIEGAVLVVEAHVRAVVDSAVSAAAGQVGNHIYMCRRQEMKEIVFVVANIHPVHFLHVFMNQMYRPFEDFRGSGDLLRGRRRKAEEGKEIAGFSWLRRGKKLLDAGVQSSIHIFFGLNNRLIDNVNANPIFVCRDYKTRISIIQIDRLCSLFLMSLWGEGAVWAINQQLQLVVYNNEMKRNSFKLQHLVRTLYWTN